MHIIEKIRKKGDLKKETIEYFEVKDPMFARFFLLPKIQKRLNNVPDRTVIYNYIKIYLYGYYTENFICNRWHRQLNRISRTQITF